MPEPETPVANKAVRRAEAGMLLTLNVTDPEVVNELQRREGKEREHFALQALRVGVIALRSAGGFVDTEKLKSEGQRLIHEVEKRLNDHWTKLDKELEGELERYFDPEHGHFNERVKALVSDDGELSRVLKEHVGGDNSSLARQLAETVGKNSPLMKYLSPDQQDGLVQTITRVAQERLEEQSKKVLGEFDLNNEDSALRRLIKQIETNFDPSNEKSALGVLSVALEDTRQQIRKDLTLDDDQSALSNLHGKLKKQINEMLAEQDKFQNDVREVLAELRGAQKERAVSPSGGFDFEHEAGEALRGRVQNYGDVFESVGETTGAVPRSKVGDHVQTLNFDSSAAGAKVVYECKRADNYTMANALAELETARKNRSADVGVFVLAASSLVDNKRMQREFSKPLTRQGNDVVLIWDPADRTTDVNLDAGLALARALAARERGVEDVAAEADWETIDKAINGIERQVEYFEEMKTWTGNVKRDADKIEDRMEKMKKSLSRELDRLTDEIESLRP